jgi:hypothetical protein
VYRSARKLFAAILSSVLAGGCVVQFGDGIYPEGYLVLREVKARQGNVEERLPMFHSRLSAPGGSRPCVIFEEGRLFVVAASQAKIEYHAGEYFLDNAKVAFAVHNTGETNADVLLARAKLRDPRTSRAYQPRFVGHDAFRASRGSETEERKESIVYYEPSPFDVRDTSRPTVYARASTPVLPLQPDFDANILLSFDKLPKRSKKFEIVLALSAGSTVEEYVFVIEKWKHFDAADRGFNQSGKAFLLDNTTQQ